MKQSEVNYIVNDLMRSSNYNIKLIYYMFNGNVPFVDIEPKIESYDIADDYKEQMKEEARRAKIKYRIIYWVLFLMIYFGVAFLLHNTWMKEDLWKDSLNGSFWIVIWLYPVIMEIFEFDQKMENKLKDSLLKRKVEKYNRDMDAYTYWQYQKKYQFWASLDGYEFEEFVGQIFHKNKYIVHSTKKSGDGGIDLILEKDNIKIAVQCKAHNKPVGPSVVRDLYGTMHHFGFDKGILVSLNGFTSGVYTFVKDKEIELITVHDLILMSSK